MSLQSGNTSYVPPHVFECASSSAAAILARQDHFAERGPSKFSVCERAQYVYALCDDGQIFRLVNYAWQPLAAIPQDDLGGAAKPKSEIDPFKDEQPGG